MPMVYLAWLQFRDFHRLFAGLRQPEDRPRVAREQDRTIAAPRAAATIGCLGERLEYSTRNIDTDQLIFREKSYIRAVRRPERIRGAISVRQRSRGLGIQR